MRHREYYVPHSSYWPIIGSLGLVTTLVGAALWLHVHWYAPYIFFSGLGIIAIMLLGWFGTVIHENQIGKFADWEDKSFRWGMVWFIFSEVCFFATFFGALFFTRLWSVPLLGGEYQPITHYLLWPNFKSMWPLLHNPNNTQFIGAKTAMEAWGLAAFNTLVLLTSGATITWAHWGLKLERRKWLIFGLLFTILLGITFLLSQAHEYYTAYTKMGLTLGAGIYGTTFFMLTGFHGLHVTIGTVMLIVIFLRSLCGHFTHDNHFGFEATAWYWHFVDVVWLLLFILVYWL